MAVLVIAAVGAAASYAEKYLTTSVGQWVMHDLRRTLYSHMQRLSLAFHDQQTDRRSDQPRDQRYRRHSELHRLRTAGGADQQPDAGRHGRRDVLLNWQFTLIALSVAPVLFVVVFHYTRRIKKASREVRKKEGEIVSVIQEVLSSIRVVKAFAREDYEQQRLEEESLESSRSRCGRAA